MRLRKTKEEVQSNRERVKRFRKQKRAAGFHQLLLWVENSQAERFKAICSERGINQEQGLAEALRLFGAESGSVICSDCKGYGCALCGDSGWIRQ